MGSSAGGHLASTIATHARPELRPNFQILFYPVITMDKSYTHIGSHDNLLGKDASAELETEFSNEKHEQPFNVVAAVKLHSQLSQFPGREGGTGDIVGLEMCIRDSHGDQPSAGQAERAHDDLHAGAGALQRGGLGVRVPCE